MHQRVVAGVRTAERVPADGDRLACAGVLVGEVAAGVAIHRDQVCAECSHRRAAGQRCGGCAVICLVVGGDAGHGQTRFADIGVQPDRLRNGVVACVGAVQRIATDRHRPARTGVLAREAGRCRARQAHGVAAQWRHGRGAGQGRRRGAIIDLVVREHAAHDETGLEDRGGQAAHLEQIVVAGIRAGKHEAADVGRLVTARIPVSEDRTAAAAQCNLVSTKRRHACSAGQGRSGGAVVDLVADRHAGQLQAGLVDGGSQATWLHDVVVARVGAVQGVTNDIHQLAVAGVLVGKAGHAGAPDHDHVAAECGHGAIAGERRGGRAVIGLVVCGDAAYGEVGLGNVGVQAGWLRNIVVAGIGAAQRIAADRHRPARASVLAQEARRRGAGQGHRIAAERRHGRGTGQRRRRGAVVDLVVREHAGHGKIGLADIGAQAARLQQVIVARVRAGKHEAADVRGLVTAGVLVGKDCAAAA